MLRGVSSGYQKTKSTPKAMAGSKKIWNIGHFQWAKDKFSGFYTALILFIFLLRVLELCLKASNL